MRRLVCFFGALLTVAGCSKNNGGPPSSGVSGTGVGVTAGIGSGTSGIGAAGTIATAGTTGASGSGAAGAASGPPAGCSAAHASVTGSAAHAAALMILNQMSPCGFSSCHMGPGKAKLVLLGVTDLKMTLVDKPSCEAPMFPLVASGGGDTALAKSWLWQKLTAPAMPGDASLIPQAAWGATPGSCGQTSGFGMRMPFGNGSNDYLEPDRIGAIRDWICSGAAGP